MKSIRINRALFQTTFFLAIAVSLFSGSTVFAQDGDPKRGFQPGNSYAIGEIENINTNSGDLSLRIPLAALPAGRAGLTAALNLIYSSKLYDTHTEFVTNTDGCGQRGRGCDTGSSTVQQTYLNESLDGGWQYGFKYEVQLINRLNQYDVIPNCTDAHRIYIYKLKVRFPDGSNREFRPTGSSSYYEDGYYNIDPTGLTVLGPGGSGNSCPTSNAHPTTMSYYSADGTYMRLDVQSQAGPLDNWTLSMPDGTRVVSASGLQRIYDRNNNYIEIDNIMTPAGHTATKIVDQMGRFIQVEYGSNPNEDHITATGFNGTTITTIVKWKGIDIFKPNYYTGDTNVYGSSLMAGFGVVDYIQLPSQVGGLTYNFGYNDAIYNGTTGETIGLGELSYVKVPSGASASYQWGLDQPNLDFELTHIPNFNWKNILKNFPKQKDLTYNQENDCGSSDCTSSGASTTQVTETWHYDIHDGLGVITAPDGGVSIESHVNSTTAWSAGLAVASGKADGSVVQRIWQQNIPNGQSTYTPNPYIKTEFTSIKDATGNFSLTAIKDYNYDKNGNVTRVAEYDWVPYSSLPSGSLAIPPGLTPKRVTVNTYYNSTPDASDSTTNNSNEYHKGTSPLLRNAKATTEIQDGSGQVLSRTELTYDNNATTANLVQQTSWDSTKGTYTNPLGSNSISVFHTYNSYGSPILETDARGIQTQLTYGTIGGFSDLYPTQIISGYGSLDPYNNSIQKTTTKQYDFSSGLVTQVKDSDNNILTDTTYDAVGRLVLSQLSSQAPPAGPVVVKQTSTEYSDAARRVIVRSDFTALADGKLVKIQHYDQLGRVRLSRQLEDSVSQNAYDETTGIKTQNRYFEGSATYPNAYQLASNPYRAASSSGASSESTMGWTRTKMDIIGRPIETQTFDATGGLPVPWGGNVSTGSTGVVLTAYDSNVIGVTDQAGKERLSQTDGLGRMINVWEITPADGATVGVTFNSLGLNGYLTSYTYDAPGNLKQVNQGSQTRSFSYSSLGRLTLASNPESGTTSYQYDNNGNLTSKTDAIGNVTSMSYDALNRLYGKSYSVVSPTVATPAVNYYYDNQTLTFTPAGYSSGASIGKLVAVTNTIGGIVGGNVYGYDQIGRVKQFSQRTDSIDYMTTVQSYNLSDEPTSVTYPSGRTVTPSYDTAARLSGLSSVGTNGTVSTGSISYTAHGAMASETYGNSGNSLIHSVSFNSRLQPIEMKLGIQSNLTSGTDIQYGYSPNNNNGNLLTESISAVTSVFSQSFTYDALNRISSAQESPSGGSGWSQSFSYDRYGNRAIIVGGIPNMTFTGSNRVVGYVYDANGNVLADGQHTYTYDAENHLSAVDLGTNSYSYDGDGHRVKKSAGNLRMVYDGGGRLIAEYDSGTNNPATKEYVYGANGLLVTIEVGGSSDPMKIQYMTSDHLGSPRIIVYGDGALHTRHDYQPFGEEIQPGMNGRTSTQGYGISDGTRQKFTSKERDDETGLDYFEARYYSSTQGRFTSVDPPLSSANSVNPQTFNRYAYCLNDPLTMTDPTGMFADFYNLDGKKIGTDGVNDGKNYVVLDKKEASQLEKGKITTSSAKSATFVGEGNVVEIATKAAVTRTNQPTADDTKGGFHEEGLQYGPDAGGNRIPVAAAPGPVADPLKEEPEKINLGTAADPAQQDVIKTVEVQVHVHSAGVAGDNNNNGGGITLGGGPTGYFDQKPSKVDTDNAKPGVTNIVVGAADGKVYFYNNNPKPIASMTLKNFLKIGSK